ncbi:hypothetical protein AYO46_06410 [Betaproteobacteria bacterium SCGC AG-212-J23]|nr:hypothetical protein AYO46_06410 [Betaproteobacteria bacterium SCGC AG-212-J23]
MLCLLLIPAGAAASCGSAFCTVNTNWDVQGAWTEPGTRLDFRYEYINQDQPMSGSRKVGVGEVPAHHDEVYTYNRNYLTTIDRTIDADWGVNVLVPVVDREHYHIHNHMGTQLDERWDFTELGDVRVLARRRLASFEGQEPSAAVASLNFGLKLPTGKTNIVNADGDAAERSLQPGSGTTDFLIGASYSKQQPTKNLSTFVQGVVQLPLNEHDDYKPGNRVSLDAGLRYGVGEQLGLLLQANALWRGRDRGAEAEPDDTGGTALFLSPGLSYAPVKAFNLYGFVQLPLYQYVNGVQLTAKRAYTIGGTFRF